MTSIRAFRPAEASEDELRDVHEILSSVEAEQIPDDPPQSFEARRAALLAPRPPARPVERWVSETDGRIVGYAHAARWPWDDPAIGLAWVGVLPGSRRRGIARPLFDTALDSLAGEGCTSLIVDSIAGAPWEEALERLGLRPVLDERISRLRIAEVDRELMASWVSKAGDRASEYELMFLEGPMPDVHLDRWCAISNVMNTAPLEGLEIADQLMTPAKWRDDEEAMWERGESHLALIAVHRPTGEFVGYTDVVLPGLRPDVANQKDTAVDPAHRDRGLGRWLKAVMVEKLIEDHPEVDRIFTANVGSNQAMLAINDEMGFRPVLWVKAWQGSLEAARSRLRAG